MHETDRSPLRGTGPLTPGYLVAVEGIDAAGKATQCQRLAGALSVRMGAAACVVEVPRYACPSGQAIKAWLHREWSGNARMRSVGANDGEPLIVGGDQSVDELAFQALMTYNRYELAPELRRRLAAGEVVVLDRWWASSYAYGRAGGLDGDAIMAASSSLPQPDAWVLLDLPVTAAGTRRKARDRHEGDPDKLNRARHAYLELADKLPMSVVDADRGLDAVAADVLDAVYRALGMAQNRWRP